MKHSEFHSWLCFMWLNNSYCYVWRQYGLVQQVQNWDLSSGLGSVVWLLGKWFCSGLPPSPPLSVCRCLLAQEQCLANGAPLQSWILPHLKYVSLYLILAFLKELVCSVYRVRRERSSWPSPGRFFSNELLLSPCVFDKVSEWLLLLSFTHTYPILGNLRWTALLLLVCFQWRKCAKQMGFSWLLQFFFCFRSIANKCFNV